MRKSEDRPGLLATDCSRDCRLRRGSDAKLAFGPGSALGFRAIILDQRWQRRPRTGTPGRGSISDPTVPTDAWNPTTRVPDRPPLPRGRARSLCLSALSPPGHTLPRPGSANCASSFVSSRFVYRKKSWTSAVRLGIARRPRAPPRGPGARRRRRRRPDPRPDARVREFNLTV